MEKKIIVRRSSAHPNTQNARIWSTGQKEMNKLIYSISILKIKILIELLSLRWTFFTACYPEHNVLPCLYTSLLCLVLMYAVEKKAKPVITSEHIETMFHGTLKRSESLLSLTPPHTPQLLNPGDTTTVFLCVCVYHTEPPLPRKEIPRCTSRSFPNKELFWQMFYVLTCFPKKSYVVLKAF